MRSTNWIRRGVQTCLTVWHPCPGLDDDVNAGDPTLPLCFLFVVRSLHVPKLFAKQNDHTVLQPGMVVVLEISTRRFDLGHLSAEITCLITDTGCEVLNSMPHTITHIP